MFLESDFSKGDMPRGSGESDDCALDFCGPPNTPRGDALALDVLGSRGRENATQDVVSDATQSAATARRDPIVIAAPDRRSAATRACQFQEAR